MFPIDIYCVKIGKNYKKIEFYYVGGMHVSVSYAYKMDSVTLPPTIHPSFHNKVTAISIEEKKQRGFSLVYAITNMLYFV